jgi:hypothetical protein
LIDALRRLARPDKWYLGAGDGLLWAPPFPAWLDAPGFWDEAHLFQYAVGPLFTVSFVHEGAVVTARPVRRAWTPAALVVEHGVGPVRARETRCVTDGRLVSAWDIHNPTRRLVTLDVVVWTALDGASLAAEDVDVARHALRFTPVVTDRCGHRTRIGASLALTPPAQSHAAYRSQVSTPGLPPRLDLTPFWDRWQSSGRLRSELRLGGLDGGGLVFLGLQRRFGIPPRGRVRFSAAIALQLIRPQRAAAQRVVLRRRRSPIRVAADDWRRFFSQVPAFRCSDPFLDRHWWYRWYGLRVNGVAAGAAPNYPHPTVSEGIGYFHVPISYSAQCHLRELRWLPDPAWARGVLRTFLTHQQPDGSLHGRIWADHLDGTDFYHADWGGAVLALDQAHPSVEFRREAYIGLARYGEWLRRTRDADATGMIDVVGQYETGQEYMSRYQAVDPDADRSGWEHRIRLQGIDVTVYAYRLFRALEYLAPDAAAAAGWRGSADRTARAVRDHMWDSARELFCDVDPRDGRRTGVKAAVCFYPYATDLADVRHIPGLARHLFDPREFWTPFPVPSSSADDPLFSPDAEWKGKRHNCPWNGRVWPMTNSHIIDALARVVRVHRPDWAPRLGHLLRRFARMMTFDGRADRPNCFEHYHPVSGRASIYRGIDDYQHSWINDLIVSHLLGVLPHGETGLTVHPLALGVESAHLERLSVAGHRVDVSIVGRRYRVRVDARGAGQGRVGEPVTVSF